jgi:hypothetical protein
MLVDPSSVEQKVFPIQCRSNRGGDVVRREKRERFFGEVESEKSYLVEVHTHTTLPILAEVY